LIRGIERLERLERASVFRRAELKKKYDAQFKVVFDAIRQLIAPPDEETEDRISGRREGRFARTKVKRFILTF
jgi:hypothetical protein